MPYYCRKCGAVVNGKYCSVCGTKASSDFAEFRKAQLRMKKALRETAFAAGEGMDRFYATRLADLASDIAFDRLLPHQALTVDTFGLASDHCWKKLPECVELAELLYERAAEVLLMK